MLKQIYAMAEVFGGDLTDEEKAVLKKLCRAAEAQWRKRLKPDITANDCEAAFVGACAWTALSGLSAGVEAGGVESFRAGEFTVSKKSGSSACLRTQAELLMAPYVDGAVLTGVPG